MSLYLKGALLFAFETESSRYFTLQSTQSIAALMISIVSRKKSNVSSDCGCGGGCGGVPEWIHNVPSTNYNRIISYRGDFNAPDKPRPSP